MKKNLAIFAGYSKEGVAEEYVLYYIKKLLEVADVIVVFDNKFKENERSKITALGAHVIDHHHGEYDFGSYKRGYQWAYDQGFLGEYDNLFFCNDSCFGPFHSISNIIDDFNQREDVDFWGFYKMTGNRRHRDHIQSYFICFKSVVFCNIIFDDFINSIKSEKNKEDVIAKYEVGLSDYLHKHGFNSAALFSGRENRTVNNDALKIFKKGFPLLKKSLFDPEQDFLECQSLLFYKRCFKKLGLNEELSIINKYLSSHTESSKLSEYLFMVWLKNSILKYIFRYKKRNGKIYVKIFCIQFFRFRVGK